MSQIWTLESFIRKLKNILERWKDPKNLVLIFNFFILITILTLVDQFTKAALTFWPHDWVQQLEENNFSEVLHGVGERLVLSNVLPLHTFSLGNPNTTLFNFLNLKAETAFLNILSFLVLSFFVIRFVCYPEFKTLIIYALLCAGVLGNSIDRILFLGVVRDVFMFSWSTAGVWNLADVYIFGTLIALIIYLISRVIFA